MKRRAYLAAAGVAGLAGCKGDIVPGVGRQVLGPDTDERTVTVADIDQTPSGSLVNLWVEMTESSANADHPARLAITTYNHGVRRAISVADGKCCLFNRNRGGSDDPEGLWLYRPGLVHPEDRTGERWVPDDHGRRGYPLYGCGPTEYLSGQSLTNPYEVWDDHRAQGYFRPGTYRWEQPIQVYEDPYSDGEEDPAIEFTWGFSLDVAVPE